MPGTWPGPIRRMRRWLDHPSPRLGGAMRRRVALRSPRMWRRRRVWPHVRRHGRAVRSGASRAARVLAASGGGGDGVGRLRGTGAQGRASDRRPAPHAVERGHHRFGAEEVPNAGEIVVVAGDFYQGPSRASVPVLRLSHDDCAGIFPWGDWLFVRRDAPSPGRSRYEGLRRRTPRFPRSTGSPCCRASTRVTQSSQSESASNLSRGASLA